MTRNRLTYILLLVATMGLGLASRWFAGALPSWLAAYAGDTLWALLVFWLMGVARPRWPSSRVAAAALGFAFLIEVSQLHQAPWINAVRATLPGRMVLGRGFLWSDLLCYTVGVLAGVGLEHLGNRHRTVAREAAHQATN